MRNYILKSLISLIILILLLLTFLISPYHNEYDLHGDQIYNDNGILVLSFMYLIIVIISSFYFIFLKFKRKKIDYLILCLIFISIIKILFTYYQVWIAN
jgi:uncharacterized BrkB/YihY/UPF0761 family membrane protein